MLINRSPMDRQRLHRRTALILVAVLLAFSIGSINSLHQPTPIFAAGSVAPVFETDEMPHTGDSADDPAIWIHPNTPSQSTIIGTDKRGGIAVYNLAGQQIEYRYDGEMNNVDLRYNVLVGGQHITLVTATNRTADSIALYTINLATRKLEPIAARVIQPGFEPYGACMYHSAESNKYYVFVTSATGAIQQWELYGSSDGKVDGTLVRSFKINDSGDSSTEGCVADDELARVYFAEENVGIWRYGAEPSAGSNRVLVDAVNSETGLNSDVEGLTIYYTSNRTGYLMVSSQGNSSYLVYQREGDNSYIDTFVIGRNSTKGIDAVQGTDGIDVTNANLGPSFPQGVFIAQDDANDVSGQNYQNFKLVPWESIANAFDPDLAMDTSWDPRRVGAPTPSPSPSPTPTPTPSPSPSPTPPPTENMRSFTPEADARVEMANAGSNFGSDTTLRADGSSTSGVRSYLRFNVRGIAHSVKSAKIRLYATTSTSKGPSIYTASNSWGETTITWNTRPGFSSPALAEHGSVTANDWIEYDVTSAVKRNGIYSFALASSSSDGLTLLSRESIAKPELILTLGEPAHQTFIPIAQRVQ